MECIIRIGILRDSSNNSSPDSRRVRPQKEEPQKLSCQLRHLSPLCRTRSNNTSWLKEIWTHVAQVATLISGKAIKKKLTEDDHRALISEALDEFRAAATARKEDVESVRA